MSMKGSRFLGLTPEHDMVRLKPLMGAQASRRLNNYRRLAAFYEPKPLPIKPAVLNLEMSPTGREVIECGMLNA